MVVGTRIPSREGFVPRIRPTEDGDVVVTALVAGARMEAGLDRPAGACTCGTLALHISAMM